MKLLCIFCSISRYIADELRKIDGIRVIGDPQVSVVAIDSEQFNIYALSDGMKARGWNLNALQFPSSIHLCCTMLHTQVKQIRIKIWRENVEHSDLIIIL
jgi:glutamate/tyrosine decarboxylase-like PLP-dependent enzyme